MENQRGITVSSSIRTIVEEIMTNRLIKTVPFSQSQAGGRKGASTTDHVFILKSLISLAIKKGTELFVTFYDIKKAYDRADMNNMLHIVNEKGFTGKIWRLTKTINENLTARVKTKAGMTREIERVTGGLQGGKIMVPLFSGSMDTLYDDLSKDRDIGITFDELTTPSLEYVDDAVTFAVGTQSQQKTLGALNEFALNHKLEWGINKCKVMEIGSRKERKDAWKLGKETIENCRSYRYLGEEISIDGKNATNIVNRLNKVKNTVMAIMTCGRNAIMRNIETNVLLRLHQTVTLPTLLYNAEAWAINKSDRKEIDKIEIWAIKHMFGLPTTTPTPAVIFATEAMYASVRVDVKRLLYLQKLLQKEEEHWALMALNVLDKNDTGWAKSIKATLRSWDLEEQWDVIAQKSKGEWKNEVEKAAERINKEMLKNDCLTKERGHSKPKTKSKTILQELEKIEYRRKPLEVMNQGSIITARALIMGRYGMLKCKANFSGGNGQKFCSVCEEIDNESHRINHCEVYKSTNLYESETKIDFSMIYSDNMNEALKITDAILKLWDLGSGRNEMKST